jgi:hypothetical protein
MGLVLLSRLSSQKDTQLDLHKTEAASQTGNSTATTLLI